jgi:hypothetical protein
MMDFLDLMDKLSEQQRQNAILVATAATKAGVNPTLAVAIAYQESRLNLNPARGSSGEIGMMQVMPATGKAMGFDEKALADPQKNIEAGIEYLKRALAATENDPKLAAVYYNGGPGALEALKSGKEPDPRVINYVRSLSSYGTFAQDQTAPSASGQPPSEEDDELVNVPPPSEPSPDSGADPGDRFLLGGAGATIGTLATGAQGVSRARTNAAIQRAGLEEAARERARMAVSGQTPPPASPQSVVRRGAASSQPAAGLRQPPPIPGLALTGNVVSPYAGHGSASANYGWKFGLPDIELENVRNMGSGEEGAQGAVKRQEAGMARARAAAPGSVLVERPSGILETISTGGTPRFSGTQLGPMPTDPGDPRNLFPAMSQPGDVQPRVPQQPQRAPTSTAPPAPSTLERVSEGFRRMMRPVAGAVATGARYVLPPVAGLSAGLDIAEAAHEYGKPQRDYTTIGLRGASALGGALSMIPTPATMAIGTGLSLGASGLQAYRDDPDILNKLRRRIFSSDNPEQMVAP